MQADVEQKAEPGANLFDSQLFNHVKKLGTLELGVSDVTGRDLKDVFREGAVPSLLITLPAFFVGLTFACFFLFEVLKGLPIHPAQYSLVGLALVTFFLLLIGLSEHVPFWIAYAIASAACITLLGAYLARVLRGIRRGLGFAVVLTALYGALYGLLVSEDNALLLGSILVFGLIASIMFMTRNVDWYALRSRA